MLCTSISLVIAFLLVGNVYTAEQCYDPDVEFYPLMGTRTAYELVHGHEKLRSLPNCQPLQIWLLSRHGTKYPENKDIPKLMNITKFRDQILDNHKNGAGHLCEKDLEIFKNWKMDPNINEKTNEELAPQGEIDLFEYAQRLKKAFPELLDINTFNSNDFIFQTTNFQRTNLSMSSFIKGLFGYDPGSLANSKKIDIKKTVAPDNSRLLLPHKNCKAWNKEFDEQNVTAERKKFLKGSEIASVLDHLTKLLGFDHGLDYDTVKSAYDMCRYEVAWHPHNVSIWCSLFKKDDLKIFEYSEDLDFYYCCGPGRDMSSKLGCGTLSQMFSNFKALSSGNTNGQPKGVFHFAHTMTLQTLMAALKIGKESVPFTALNYATSQNRSYHVSKLGPFATSVLAVFYKCPATQPEYKVSLHVAEEFAPLSNCPKGVCDWELFKKEYRKEAESCNMEFCDNSNFGIKIVGPGHLVILLFAIVVGLLR